MREFLCVGLMGLFLIITIFTGHFKSIIKLYLWVFGGEDYYIDFSEKYMQGKEKLIYVLSKEVEKEMDYDPDTSFNAVRRLVNSMDDMRILGILSTRGYVWNNFTKMFEYKHWLDDYLNEDREQ